MTDPVRAEKIEAEIESYITSANANIKSDQYEASDFPAMLSGARKGWTILINLNPDLFVQSLSAVFTKWSNAKNLESQIMQCRQARKDIMENAGLYVAQCQTGAHTVERLTGVFTKNADSGGKFTALADGNLVSLELLLPDLGRSYKDVFLAAKSILKDAAQNGPEWVKPVVSREWQKLLLR